MADGAPRERAALAKARRIVVKIGSHTLATEPGIFAAVAKAVAAAHSEGRAVVLVSSGAIALGRAKLGLRARPREMALLQAAAAAGQSVLMRAWDEALGALGIAVAQVLLTHADLADRVRANNARAALSALLEAGAVPILNENDSVAVEEIKFGDNDQLAAMVAALVGAELVVLLSDVAGLLDEAGVRVPLVRDVTREALGLLRPEKGPDRLGSGGMRSKLEAARRATLAGSHVVIAEARAPGIVEAVLRGEDVGTFFAAAPDRLSAKKAWIAFTLRPKGALVLDRGASEAVRSKGKSVLAVGVVGVRGAFRAGDAVVLVDPDGAELGRGLARCAAEDAARVARLGRDERSSFDRGLDVLVHRDEMAIWK